MSAEIWVSIITGVFTLAGVVITVLFGNKKSKEQNDLTLYRIKELEKKQDKHNSLMERVFALEKKEAVIEEEIESVRQHIDDLHG